MEEKIKKEFGLIGDYILENEPIYNNSFVVEFENLDFLKVQDIVSFFYNDEEKFVKIEIREKVTDNLYKKFYKLKNKELKFSVSYMSREFELIYKEIFVVTLDKISRPILSYGVSSPLTFGIKLYVSDYKIE